jgi:type I restriction enzyme S subunit
MNNETVVLLEKHFDTAFAAPDGIKKLRELILTLAMQGKLVPQDPTDRPASELLKAIGIGKKENKKTSKTSSKINLDDMPYGLPNGWEWVRLGEIGETNIGLTYAPSDISDIGIPVLRSNSIQNGKLDLTGLKRVNKEVKANVLVKEGDLLICARNGSKALVGKTALITGLSEEMAFGAFMAIFRSPFNNYLLRFINSPLFRKMIDEVNTMTINQITQNNLKSTICPLPPLEEQHRIVAEIDRLMARCDELEKLRTDRNQKRTTVHTAAIDRLLKAQNDRAFSTAWSFITQHFSELYSVKENVTELRKVILQLAVMGKLVPQDPNDEPASELLKAIELEKQRLVKEKKISKSDLSSDLNLGEVPYELPKTWEWITLEHLATKIGSGSTPRGGKEAYEIEGIPFLRSQNIWNDGLRIDDTAYISREIHKKMAATTVLPMDILLNITGASLGRCSLIPDDFEEANVSQHVTIIRCAIAEARKFIHCFLLSPCGQSMIWTRQVGMSREGLSKKVLEQFHIPLPPIAEQHRIVAEIDRLMEFCDRLEASLEATKIKQTDLLNAVMSRV